MASAFTHAFTGLALGRIFTGASMPPRFWILAAICGMLPDIDSVGFMLGVPYESLWGHRGVVHSLLFALMTGVAVTTLAFGDRAVLSGGWWQLVIFFFVVTASHSVLDAMTTGGLGVAFFAPFNNTRYFFTVRPIRVSPIGIASFFSERGLRVILSELIWVWLPLVLLAGFVMLGHQPRIFRNLGGGE